MDSSIKLPLYISLNQLADSRVTDTFQLAGKNLPCSVVEVISSGIVTVKFSVNASPFTLPQVTMPIIGAQYLRYPITPGDKGYAVPADTFLGAQTGLGGGAPLVGVQPANLSALAFVWIGNSGWSQPDDSQAVVQYAPNGVISRDTESASVVAVTPAQVDMNTPTVNNTGNSIVGSGATGTFTTLTGQTVTVQDGLITNIY